MDWTSDIPDRMRVLFDSIHNPIIAIDENGVVSYCNRAAGRLIGIEMNELLGRKLTSVIARLAASQDSPNGRRGTGSKS